jgi:trehalose-6-phosphatase
VLGRWTFFFNFKGTPSWILQKKILPPLEPKLLVMLGRIGEALQIVYEVLHIV